MKVIIWMLFPAVLWILSFTGSCFAQTLTAVPVEGSRASPSEFEETHSMVGDDQFTTAAILEPTPPKNPAKQGEFEESEESISDPLKPWNRIVFHFNDKFYFWVVKPVAQGYRFVVPEEFRVCFRNCFSNFIVPVRLVNCLFQGKWKAAGNEVARFGINTTLGFLGFFDQAKDKFEIRMQDADFGQTLGFWGMEAVFYVEWPILGPSSLRESIGFIVDLTLDPRTYISFITSSPVIYTIRPFEVVNETSLRIGEYEALKKATIDPYIGIRDAYYQYRQNKIKKSKSRNGSPTSRKIDNSKQSREFKESRKVEVVTKTPPLEPRMKKTEQIPSNVGERLSFSVPDRRTVTWTFAVIRWGARNDYPIVATVNQGDKLSIIGESGEWFYVQLENGQHGWVNNRVAK